MSPKDSSIIISPSWVDSAREIYFFSQTKGMQLSSLCLHDFSTYLSHYSHISTDIFNCFWSHNILLKLKQHKSNSMTQSHLKSPQFCHYTQIFQGHCTENMEFVHVYLSLWHRDTAVQPSLHIPQHFSQQQSRWQWLRLGVQCQQILLCLRILSG